MLKDINDLFGLKLTKALTSGSGEAIKLTVLPENDELRGFLPKKKDSYVFEAATLVDVCIAYEENIPLLIWGLHGSGKSTLAEQVALRLMRGTMRVQHTVDTDAADIVGQWVLEGDKTTFHYGPLARAMRDGLVYIADEYDFALPNVLAIYQAVLEGEALFIKNAPADMAIVEPHPNFRFVATGNTNGSGDETGLYQGTQIQNAANYSRFDIAIKLNYSANEDKILTGMFGSIPESDIKLLMEFTKEIRTAYDKKIITNTFSTRELISVTRLAILRGRDNLNFRYGVQQGFTNRLSSTDAAAVLNHANRIFPKA